MGIIPGPFADFCNLTFPRDNFDPVCDALLGVATQAGGHIAAEGLCRIGNTGTMKFGVRHSVGCFSVSGGALTELRKHDLFNDFLFTAGQHPHRVSTLHATLDRPEDTPTVLKKLYRAACAGRIALSRKTIKPRHVQRILGPSSVDGRDTGTLYLGKRTSGVWAKVYDKRHEILGRYCDHAHLEHFSEETEATFREMVDPGPLTRYEVSLGRHVGLSLRDVADPTAVFWHFVGDVLLPRPIDAPTWSPAAEGYELPPPAAPDHYRQLEFLLEHSADLRRAVKLAHLMGPNGLSWFVGRLKSLVPSAPIAGASTLVKPPVVSPA